MTYSGKFMPACRRQAAEEGLEASAIRRGGAEMRALGLNHWEDKQLQWIVSVVTR